MPELPGARHREVAVGDVVLHVAEVGPRDGSPIVLVHGWPQNWWCWNRVAPLLAGKHRCVMPDLRGHGWSSAPAGGYGKEQLADDLVRMLDALGIERTAYVGHDWGAYVGFLIGMREPDRLSRLLCLSIPHLWLPLRDRLNPFRALALAYQLPLSTPMVGERLLRNGLTRRILAAANAGFSEHDLDVYDSTMGSADGARVTAALYRTFLLRELPAVALGRYRDPPLDIETQLLIGTRDPITALMSSPDDLAGAPRMTVERVPGAGHFLPQERPRLIAERASNAPVRA